MAVSWLRGGTIVPARVGDINAHGLFIRTVLDAWPGELLEIVLELPDGLMKACVIARFIGKTESGHGIGAEFFVLAEGDRDRWDAYFRSELRELTEPEYVEVDGDDRLLRLRDAETIEIGELEQALLESTDGF